MPQYKDEPPAVRVYTVCDESKYLIVRNVPALGCGDELKQLFATFGEVEECKPMDAEDCEAFTDVYWIKFHLISNARFAKRKLDESVFLGNRLQVSYATEYETLSDTKEKLEGRTKEVLGRLKSGRSRAHETPSQVSSKAASNCPLSRGTPSVVPQQLDLKQGWYAKEMDQYTKVNHSSITRVSSDQDYFPSQSMNETVKRVREKLDKIESSSSNMHSGTASKKMRVDNRRRI